mgnify:CR=1 FL=1
MSDKKRCINSLLLKLNGLDRKMFNLSKNIEQIKNMFSEHNSDEQEECPDVIESEKALVEAIEKLYVEELMTREPEGDA